VSLIAIDLAILPPEPVSNLAVSLNAQLQAERSKGLRLDADHLPHITLTQQFVQNDMLEAVLDRISTTVRHIGPLALYSPGAVSSGDTVWLGIEPALPLLALHRRLMDALAEFERGKGGRPAAFVDADARPADVRWVNNYRARAAFDSYRPHITLGHGDAPKVDPVRFEAVEVAACQLGRFCTCRRVLRAWTLSGEARSS
jgi:2'-5' RNA ligase